MAGMNSDTNHFSVWDSTALAVLVCSILALYNAVELEILVLTTFRRYRGLYFWSLVLATFGIVPYVLGFFVEYFRWSHLTVGTSVVNIGWCLMVTGQSVVLYSRLWIVFANKHQRLLVGVKRMIIFNAILLHGLTIIVVYASRAGDDKTARGRFSTAYNFVERIQMSGFFLQELFLSGLYIWKAFGYLRTAEKKRIHRVMLQLLSINVIIVILDIALLATEFRSLHVIQQTLKSLVYSIKLKLEMAILSKLIELSTQSFQTSLTYGEAIEFRDPNWTPRDSRPAVKSNEEDIGLQHVEPAYSPNANVRVSWPKDGTVRTREYFPDPIEPTVVPDEHDTPPDKLYANAVRKYSLPG